MKKLTAILLALLMVMSLSACGSGEKIELNTTLTDILNSISNEFQVFTADISDTSDSIIESMDNTYDGYENQKAEVYALYDKIENESENLFSKIQNYSIEYFENVATLGVAEYDNLDYAMDEFYRVWSESMENYHDVCFDSVDKVYSESVGLLKTQFHNDMIDSDTYFKEKEEMDREYEEIHSTIFEMHSSAWSKINSDYNLVDNGFVDGIFNVDTIFEKEYNEATADEE